MRFIEERLREKSVSLRGQKMNEILDPNMSKNHAVKGDDRILDCCMYFHQVTQKRVSLLSNDRNLSIKVMVHDIKKHNDAWVANAKCQVNVPIESEFVGLETKLNTQPPEISSTWKSLDFSLFLLFGVSISLLALMPSFAAKSADAALKHAISNFVIVNYW